MTPDVVRACPHLLVAQGYAAILVCMALERLGLPIPGRAVLLTAATYAGTTHRLALVPLVLVAASGAIMGDSAGFATGRLLHRAVRHHPPLGRRVLGLGCVAFRRKGPAIVFWLQWVRVARTWTGVLAGGARMPWGRFLAYNSLGVLLWALIDGVGGYLLGPRLRHLTALVAGLVVALAVLSTLEVLTDAWLARRTCATARQRACLARTSGGQPSGLRRRWLLPWRSALSWGACGAAALLLPYLGAHVAGDAGFGAGVLLAAALAVLVMRRATMPHADMSSG